MPNRHAIRKAMKPAGIIFQNVRTMGSSLL